MQRFVEFSTLRVNYCEQGKGNPQTVMEASGKILILMFESIRVEDYKYFFVLYISYSVVLLLLLLYMPCQTGKFENSAPKMSWNLTENI